MNRRDFFGGFLRSKEQGRVQIQEWVPVVGLAELSPGTVLSCRVQETSFTLHSDEQGVWTRSEDGAAWAIRIGPSGQIEVNLSIPWPNHQRISHLTGEVIENIDEKRSDS